MITVDDFQQAARSWLESHRHLAPRDYGPICPPELVADGITWQREMFGAGYAGLHWPSEHGGQGLTPAHNAAWQYECAQVGVPSVLNMVGLVLAGSALLRYGSAEQQARHLRPTLAAESVWCQLFSEPEAGSDLASLRTTATALEDGFVVNGQKVWCSGARASNWGILIARTDPAAPKHHGLSFFVIPMHLPGIEVRPLRQMTGDAEFDEVFFTDVVIPSDSLLGPLHGGWGVGMSVLTNERGHVGTTIIGLERRLQSMLKLSRGRELGAVHRQRLAMLYSRGFAYKAMVTRQGPQASTAASLMKLGITDLSFETAMLRGDIAGIDAQLAGPAADAIASAPGGRIAGGSSQIQRTIIGERLLGLPREPAH